MQVSLEITTETPSDWIASLTVSMLFLILKGSMTATFCTPIALTTFSMDTRP